MKIVNISQWHGFGKAHFQSRTTPYKISTQYLEAFKSYPIDKIERGQYTIFIPNPTVTLDKSKTKSAPFSIEV